MPSQRWLEARRRTAGTASSGRPAMMVRHATPDDLEAVTAVHEAAFPGFLMTRLGPAFLRRYYATILSCAEKIFLVAEHNGRIVGFAAGFTDPPAFYAALRRRRFAFAVAMVPALVRDPRLVGRVASSSRWASDQAGDTPSAVCELASIGVHPDEGGHGIGTTLVREFAAAGTERGASQVVLTTDATENDAVLGFYERLGFAVHRELERGPSRRMLEYRLDIEGPHG